MPIAMTRQLWLAAPMMRGDDIMAVQRRLAERGMSLTQDGLYGAGTRDAVRRFQAEAHLAEDGVVGPDTWKALFQGSDRASTAPLPGSLDPDSVRLLAEPHRYYRDGCQWRLTSEGVEISGVGIESPSDDQRRLAARVMVQFREALLPALARYAVPIETVIACICTESSGNPAPPVRMEPGCSRQDPSSTPSRCSHGLMQTLLSTARAALHNPSLTLEALAQPEVSILAGTAYMAQQSTQTRHDPPLAAAAYNAGSLRYDPTPGNRWRLVQYPIGTSRHVDRFVLFTNAAFASVDQADLPDSVPSLRRLLR